MDHVAQLVALSPKDLVHCAAYLAGREETCKRDSIAGYGTMQSHVSL